MTIPSQINGLPVNRIGDYAFSLNTTLKGVTLGTNLTRIGQEAFSGCTGPNVSIGNSVISIGESAFSGCNSLTRVTLGNHVTSLGVPA